MPRAIGHLTVAAVGRLREPHWQAAQDEYARRLRRYTDFQLVEVKDVVGRALPDATIVPHPVFPGHVMRRWWLWPGSAALIIGEYHKFLWSWLRLEVVRSAEAPRRAAESRAA